MKTSTRLAGVTGAAATCAATVAVLLGSGTANAIEVDVDHTPGPGKITTTLGRFPAVLTDCYSHVVGNGVDVKSSPVTPDATGSATLVVSPLQPGTYDVSVRCWYAAESREFPIGGAMEVTVTQAPPKPNPWGSLGTGSLGG